MSAPALRLWSCPNGKHQGARAPGRLRRDDARRWCLECCAETGKMTERACAALEKKRDRNAEVRAKREAAKRVTEKAKRIMRETREENAKRAASTYDDVDMRRIVPFIFQAMPSARARPVVFRRSGRTRIVDGEIRVAAHTLEAALAALVWMVAAGDAARVRAMTRTLWGERWEVISKTTAGAWSALHATLRAFSVSEGRAALTLFAHKRDSETRAVAKTTLRAIEELRT